MDEPKQNPPNLPKNDFYTQFKLFLKINYPVIIIFGLLFGVAYLTLNYFLFSPTRVQITSPSPVSLIRPPNSDFDLAGYVKENQDFSADLTIQEATAGAIAGLKELRIEKDSRQLDPQNITFYKDPQGIWNGYDLLSSLLDRGLYVTAVKIIQNTSGQNIYVPGGTIVKDEKYFLVQTPDGQNFPVKAACWNDHDCGDGTFSTCVPAPQWCDGQVSGPGCGFNPNGYHCCGEEIIPPTDTSLTPPPYNLGECQCETSSSNPNLSDIKVNDLITFTTWYQTKDSAPVTSIAFILKKDGSLVNAQLVPAVLDPGMTDPADPAKKFYKAQANPVGISAPGSYRLEPKGYSNGRICDRQSVAAAATATPTTIAPAEGESLQLGTFIPPTSAPVSPPQGCILEFSVR